MASIHNAPKWNSYLIRVKVNSVERMVGLYKIKQFQVCNNITKTDSFTCGNYQTNFKINHRFDWMEVAWVIWLSIIDALINM